MSMALMEITILIVTYDRPRELRATLDALIGHVRYSGLLHWHIADDGTPGNYLPELQRDYPGLPFTYTVTQRQGWGANVNKALQYPRMTDLIFLCEDDYVSRYPLDLNQGAALLSACPQLGSVRYDGLAGHVGLHMVLQEADTPLGRLPYLELDPQASTNLNLYSNRPHLRHRRFHDHYGLYPEDVSLGRCEEIYAHRIKDDRYGPRIAVLSNGIDCAFDHIGISRQGTAEDTLFKGQ